MNSVERYGVVTASVTASPIEATGHDGNDGTHQLRMRGDKLFIHITPENAKQWIETLTPIAKEAK